MEWLIKSEKVVFYFSNKGLTPDSILTNYINRNLPIIRITSQGIGLKRLCLKRYAMSIFFYTFIVFAPKK